MKVKELIEWLKGLDNQEAEILVMGKDSIGASRLSEETTTIEIAYVDERGNTEDYVIKAN